MKFTKKKYKNKMWNFDVVVPLLTAIASAAISSGKQWKWIYMWVDLCEWRVEDEQHKKNIAKCSQR